MGFRGEEKCVDFSGGYSRIFNSLAMASKSLKHKWCFDGSFNKICLEFMELKNGMSIG